MVLVSLLGCVVFVFQEISAKYQALHCPVCLRQASRHGRWGASAYLQTGRSALSLRLLLLFFSVFHSCPRERWKKSREECGGESGLERRKRGRRDKEEL